MSTMLAWSIAAAQVLLGLAMACAVFRILWGPRAQDRVVGFDTLSVNVMLPRLKYRSEPPRALRELSFLYPAR